MPLRPTLPRRRRDPEGSPPRRSQRSRRSRRQGVLGLLVALMALGHLVSFGATPIADGPREPLPRATVPDRWSPPLPVTDERFATFPLVDDQGRRGLWLLPSSAVPLEFVVEQEVVDRFGEDELRAAVEVWNDTPGSRFGASIVRIVEAGVDERRRDGVNRIFIDRRSCGGRYLARAHLWPGETVVRGGSPARYIPEVDLGICDRLRPEQLAGVMRHELGHIAGFDHLCDEGEDCHRRGMAPDNTCRVMSPRAHPCQQPTQGDLDGLVHLHPRLPRVTGGDGRTTSASTALATHPTRRASLRAVITHVDAAPDLRVAGATLAAHLGAPHVLVDDECTTGPDGRALDRAVAIAGNVVAVGPHTEGCLASLRGAWALRVDHLPDHRAVTDRALEYLVPTGRPPAQLFVAPGTDLAGEDPIGPVAAAAAAAARAPLVLLEDPEDLSAILDRIDASDRITEITLVGDVELVPLSVQLRLANVGVHVRRVPASDAGEAATALAAFDHLWGPGPRWATLAATDEFDHLVVAVGLAAREGGFVLPVDDRLRPAHAALLREQVDRGAIVGGTRAISRERQIALSRLVDDG